MNKVITISGTTLAILSMFFIALSSINLNSGSVHAAETSTNTEVALNVDSVINISAPSTATINCTPGATAAAAELCTTNVTVGVGTNNITGYTLQMNATNGSPTALTNSAASPAATIPTLSQAYSSANFPTNYWGYTGGLDKSEESGGYDCSTNGGNYCPVLAYNSDSSAYAPNHVIKVTDAPSITSNTDITFGAKVDISKPSGTYTTSVTFTAITNAPPYNGIVDGMDMQDIDSGVCAATPLYSVSNTIYTVIDSRDNKEYTVAKLADGNCWMTQNLALGGSTAMTLTPANTDIASNFTLPASDIEGYWTGSFDTPEFFDYTGNYDDSSTKYGNYYNWSAATAGSGTSALDQDGDEAPYSICPKNWRLPSAGSSYATSEQYNMINNYINSGTWDDSNPGLEYWYNVTTTDFTSAPVSLVFSGYYYYGYVHDQNDEGYWWSSTAEYVGLAYHLKVRNYNGGSVSPREAYDKDCGYPVRCLVPGT